MHVFIVANVEDIEKVTRVTGAHLKPYVRDDDPSGGGSEDGGDDSDPQDNDPSGGGSEDGGDNSDPHDGDEPPEKKRKVMGDQPWGASGLGLDEYDKDRLVSNNWLADKHINACSVLLKKVNPSQSGVTGHFIPPNFYPPGYFILGYSIPLGCNILVYTILCQCIPSYLGYFTLSVHYPRILYTKYTLSQYSL